MRIQCACCHELITPRNNLQTYCSKEQCQRKRKSEWQKTKLTNDVSYRQNQADSQRVWRDKNKDYMPEYRKRHPQYVERNREQQKVRRKNCSTSSLPQNPDVVKMDARLAQIASIPLLGGIYMLSPAGVVNMDAVMVQLTVLERVT